MSLAAPLLKKLTLSNELDADDLAALEHLPIRRRVLAARETIVRDGDRPNECCLLIEGFLYRSKTTIDGQQQILSLHIPGEVPDLQSLHLKVLDHDLLTLSSCVLGFILHEDMRRMTFERPRLAAALWRETLVDASIFREWIVNVGSRNSKTRLAHLFAEILYRLDAVGLAKDGRVVIPLTQNDIAGCLGTSVVHVGRIMAELRTDGLILSERGEFRFPDREGLEAKGQFDPAYLHLSKES